jgi:predicted nucleic acid-binding protein
VKVVSDAGPLMALAKVGRLDLLFQVFPRIWTPPAVYEELITAGLRLGAPDALLLEGCYRSEHIAVRTPRAMPAEEERVLGSGEAQSIRLALEEQAEWLLIDDFDARRAASDQLKAAGLETRVTGTLGVIVMTYQRRLIPRQTALEVVEALTARPDIWISADLSRRIRDILLREPDDLLQT